MPKSPYHDLPDIAFWRRSVSNAPSYQVDPVGAAPIMIDKTTKVISAGSCFASNVTRYLVDFGYNYIFTETLHSFFRSRDPELSMHVGLGDFSAGYGNIYTAAQMLQTLERAMELRQPVEDRWPSDDGTIIDPFRPRIKLRASSSSEFEMLRKQHFRAIIKTFELGEVLIFTFGLTEGWRSKDDGTVFPVCPGTSGGEFDASRHEFVNFNVGDVIRDFQDFVRLARSINSNLKIILTVSPVPLVATATSSHVLVATTYSKSVLRVACEELATTLPNVFYFPSYEIITGAHASYDVFESDRRSVSRQGVDHVMRVFFRHVAGDESAVASLSGLAEGAPTVAAKFDPPKVGPEAIAEALCEEELLEVATRKI